MVMVMLLLFLFGFTTYSLIYAGSETQHRIVDEKNAQVDARIALSYINVKLRQNDSSGLIFVRPNGVNGGNAIVIQYRDEYFPEYDYDTWIYWDRGYLYEILSMPDEEPAWFGANTIVGIAGFDTEINDGGVIVNTITYRYQGRFMTISNTISLRSCLRIAAVGVGSG